MKKVEPLLPEEFEAKLKTSINSNYTDYEAHFKPAIELAINYAIGPYFWFVPDNRAMKIIAASENMIQLTPYATAQWVGQGVGFWISNVHPEDRFYLLAATAIGAEFHEISEKTESKNIRVNIYCRMLDAHEKYRWTLVQYPSHFFNNEGKIESTLVLITDLSCFEFLVNAPLMSIIDNNNKELQYFKVVVNEKKLVPVNMPRVTQREQEILRQMVKGLNTPEIASFFNISYHTVENHKRNLRCKTNTKTTAELIYFIMSNNLL